MRRPPPRSARTDTLFPYTTLSRYHRWFRTVLVPQVRHLGIVTIDAQGILPEKKLVDSRCLRAPPASQQRVRSPEIQLAVGKLLRDLRRQGPHAKRVNHQVSAAGRPKVGDVALELQDRKSVG